MIKKLFERNDTQRLRAYAHKSGAFDSKKTAFDYFFLIEGKSIEEAEKLANTIAQARGVPDILPPKPSGIDKAKSIFSEVKKIADDNPRLTEVFLGFASGAIASLGGVFVGSSVADSNENKDPEIEIDKSQIPQDL